MHKNGRFEEHERFKELGALAHGGECSKSELRELKSHLRSCNLCRDASDEYSLIVREGLPFLAANPNYTPETESWNQNSSWNRLRSRVREAGQLEFSRRSIPESGKGFPSFWFGPMPEWTVPAAVAVVLIAVAAGAYRLGSSALINPALQRPAPSARLQEADIQRNSIAVALASQAEQLWQSREKVSKSQQEIARLRTALQVAEDQSSKLLSGIGARDNQYRKLLEQRDKLASELREAEEGSQKAQAELTSLRDERERTLSQTVALETKIHELTAGTRDQERRLQDDEQYLASDRDIRELMGARKLYIADVFDVDSGSRTRKPFGRVFYTQNKSLIFYAFDLDHEPGVKNASAFQVWGQRDAEAGEKPHAMNLGIMFMDSESNRRWVLRLDDPKHLAEIDAVFVTVEPHGGSQKPTGKPFLYALLRKEANHP
jgi:uncharacterized protein YdcH (DUF465 family)